MSFLIALTTLQTGRIVFLLLELALVTCYTLYVWNSDVANRMAAQFGVERDDLSERAQRVRSRFRTLVVVLLAEAYVWSIFICAAPSDVARWWALAGLVCEIVSLLTGLYLVFAE